MISTWYFMYTWWKQVPALRFISTFSAKFRMIIRIPKKYADNSENRLNRYLSPGLSPKNLFNFYKKSNKFPHQNPSFVPPPSLPALPLGVPPSRTPDVLPLSVAPVASLEVALNVAPKRCRLWCRAAQGSDRKPIRCFACCPRTAGKMHNVLIIN